MGAAQVVTGSTLSNNGGQHVDSVDDATGFPSHLFGLSCNGAPFFEHDVGPHEPGLNLKYLPLVLTQPLNALQSFLLYLHEFWLRPNHHGFR